MFKNIHLKQPIELYIYSLVDLWERYGFYTMRGILVLYMTHIFHYTDAHSYSVFAAFTALLYLTPTLGGYIADNFIGPRNAILIGAIALMTGYLILALPGANYLYIGLGTIIVGSGLFMPNIATKVSHLYKNNDIRREGGFSIFYTAINIGALIPPLIVAIIIKLYGWHTAFLMASFGVLIGLIIFFIYSKKSIIKKDSKTIITFILLLFPAICFFSYLVEHTTVSNVLLFTIGGAFIVYTFIKSLSYPVEERNKLLACLTLILTSIVFSILYQQAGMSFTIYTEFNVVRNIDGWNIPTVMFQSLNPFFIILLGPILANLWVKLGHINKNPSIPVKFGLGTCFMGLGFIIMPIAIMTKTSYGQINFLWIVLSYFLQTLGEMLVSPIGLSMVSDLSPRKIVGMMMGTWYFATSIADALAGFVSKWTTTPSGNNNPIITSSNYSHIFGWIGMISILTGIIIILINKPIKHMISPTKKFLSNVLVE